MTTVFLDGPVITGTGEILEHAAVLVENDKIVKIANREINILPGAKKIPLKGRTLLPGLIDSHVHMCIDGGPDPLSTTLNESQTATRVDSEALYLDDRIGTIEEGKQADLVVTS